MEKDYLVNGLHKLIGYHVRIFLSNDQFVEGVLLHVNEDHIIVDIQGNVFYLALHRIYAFAKNAKEFPIIPPQDIYVNKSNFTELLRDVKYKWVTINPFDKQMLTGILTTISEDYIVLILKEQSFHVQKSYIANLFLGVYAEEGNKQNESELSTEDQVEQEENDEKQTEKTNEVPIKEANERDSVAADMDEKDTLIPEQKDSAKDMREEQDGNEMKPTASISDTQVEEEPTDEDAVQHSVNEKEITKETIEIQVVPELTDEVNLEKVENETEADGKELTQITVPKDITIQQTEHHEESRIKQENIDQSLQVINVTEGVEPTLSSDAGKEDADALKIKDTAGKESIIETDATQNEEIISLDATNDNDAIELLKDKNNPETEMTDVEEVKLPPDSVRNMSEKKREKPTQNAIVEVVQTTNSPEMKEELPSNYDNKKDTKKLVELPEKKLQTDEDNRVEKNTANKDCVVKCRINEKDIPYTEETNHQDMENITASGEEELAKEEDHHNEIAAHSNKQYIFVVPRKILQNKLHQQMKKADGHAQTKHHNYDDDHESSVYVHRPKPTFLTCKSCRLARRNLTGMAHYVEKHEPIETPQQMSKEEELAMLEKQYYALMKHAEKMYLQFRNERLAKNNSLRT